MYPNESIPIILNDHNVQYLLQRVVKIWLLIKKVFPWLSLPRVRGRDGHKYIKMYLKYKILCEKN